MNVSFTLRAVDGAQETEVDDGRRFVIERHKGRAMSAYTPEQWAKYAERKFPLPRAVSAAGLTWRNGVVSAPRGALVQITWAVGGET